MTKRQSLQLNSYNSLKLFFIKIKSQSKKNEVQLSRITRPGKSMVLTLIHVDNSACFHPYKIQDTSHTIGQTLIVIVLPWQSVQSVIIAIRQKRRKQRQWPWKSRRKEEWCLPYRPPQDPFWAACIQPALSCLWHKSSYSLSPSPSLSPTRSRFLSTLPRSLCLSD